MRYKEATEKLKGREVATALGHLYPQVDGARERYQALLKQHQEAFDTKAEVTLLCAPGRSELIGNHTDHNKGLVLAAAINLDIAAAVSPRDDHLVNLHSEGYAPILIDVSQLEADSREAGTTQALIRGVARGMKDRGYVIGGFDCVITSQVLSGSGLSSSAAFEMLICFILDCLYNQQTMDPISRAQVGQFAENRFFMKPSGLMDQMASSFGGLVAIDFAQQTPKVEPIHYSFAQAGYALTIVATDSSHDNLTDAYSAIPAEMIAVANVLGGSVLRDVEEETLLSSLGIIRNQVGDRAMQRAMHFYQENLRVTLAVRSLMEYDLDAFFRQINASGLSSWTLLQNISIDDKVQPMALALATAQSVLGDRGACRVHGGGFAGTTLNFVPLDLMPQFATRMEALFGPGCYHVLDVRQQGPVKIL